MVALVEVVLLTSSSWMSAPRSSSSVAASVFPTAQTSYNGPESDQCIAELDNVRGLTLRVFVIFIDISTVIQECTKQVQG